MRSGGGKDGDNKALVGDYVRRRFSMAADLFLNHAEDVKSSNVTISLGFGRLPNDAPWLLPGLLNFCFWQFWGWKGLLGAAPGDSDSVAGAWARLVR